MNNFLSILANLDSKKLLSITLIVGAFYYYTMFESGATLEDEIASLQTQFKAEEDKKRDTEVTLQEEKRMKEAVGILSEQYQIISKRIPTELSTFEINTAVEAYAKETQVRITGTKPGTPEKMEIVEEVPLDVTLVGRYPELLQFIYNLSSSERITRVKNLSIAPVSAEDKSANPAALKFTGVIVGYKLASEAPKTQGAQQ